MNFHTFNLIFEWFQVLPVTPLTDTQVKSLYALDKVEFYMYKNDQIMHF